jgi:DNA-binding NarL/FixJ family response regulator
MNLPPRLTPVPATDSMGSPNRRAYYGRMKSRKESESESNANKPVSGLQVVLVDDSVPVRERLAASVSAVHGVALVRQAEDVPSGLRLFDEREPDVVILDIELPGQSGLDFVKIVRRRGCSVLIIMLSNHDHPKLRQKCADLGANFYFHKLTQFERVAEVCGEVAGRREPQGG